jgi:hypothetical protein
MFKPPEWFTVEKFWELKEAGYKQYEIQEMLGTTNTTLRNLLKRMGIEKVSIHAKPGGEVLTEQDYLIAEKNGIGRGLAYQRYYIRNYDKQKAITKPPERAKECHIYGDIRRAADKNGIKKTTFYNRIHRDHMTPEQAATTPLKYNKKPKEPESILTPAEQKIAKKNGISEDTARYRILGLGMDRHKAITMQDKKSRRA